VSVRVRSPEERVPRECRAGERRDGVGGAHGHGGADTTRSRAGTRHRVVSGPRRVRAGENRRLLKDGGQCR
jgi:hypothetical protein